jgi:hypothetical protein
MHKGKDQGIKEASITASVAYPAGIGLPGLAELGTGRQVGRSHASYNAGRPAGRYAHTHA